MDGAQELLKDTIPLTHDVIDVDFDMDGLKSWN